MTCFVVALACEAKPLIEHYGLKADLGATAFRLYRSERDELVISGVGRVAAAAATAFLAARSETAGAWVNVGVAGHRSLPKGSLVIAEKIEERTSGLSFYPRRHFSSPAPGSRLITVDEVETGYEQEAAYDMEGSAFWATANRFQHAELVHCLKVVSDSPEEPVRRLDAAAIEELVASKLEDVDAVRSSLQEVVSSLPEKGGFEVQPFSDVHHLSTTHLRRLERLVERWAAVHRQPTGVAAGQVLAVFQETPPRETATQALDRVQTTLEATPVEL